MKASLARLWSNVVRNAFAAVDIIVMSSHSANAAEEPRLMSGSGTPTVALTTVGLYMNKSASGMNDLLGCYQNGAWTWAELDATAAGFVDGSTWYTTDTVQGLADAVVAAIGGTSQGVRNYTNGYVVTDNQTLFASIDALDAAFGGALASLTTTTKTLVGGINELASEAQSQGAVAVARLLMANQPTDGDTVTIGADVYEFVNTGVNTVVNDDAHIAVVIAGSAALTRANLIAAINGVGTAGATVTLADTVTPALEDGTEDVVADEIGTTVRVRSAGAPGGTASAADPNILLAEAITDAADVWDVGAVNLNTLAGNVASQRSVAHASMAISAAMIASGVRVDFPFAVAGFITRVRSAAGGTRTGVVGDLAVAGASGILFTFDGGAAPAIQDTDVLTVTAWS